MGFVLSPFREKGECTHEWFRVKDNGVRDKISSQGEFLEKCNVMYSSIIIYFLFHGNLLSSIIVLYTFS
jgi:hypothetical protein